MRPKLLDAFCGAGGCSFGYHQAGFDVVGVDIKHQRRYPFEFRQGDAIEYIREHGHEYDVIAASPPCQAHSFASHYHGLTYKDWIPETRAALMATGLPWVMENVVGSPLNTCIELCGTMFGLEVYRHRRFESNVLLFQPYHPKHVARCTEVGRKHKAGEFMTVAGHFANVEKARVAMGIDWMTRDELAQSIPPAYAFHIGAQLITYLERSEAA